MIRLIRWGEYRLAIIAEGSTIIAIDDDVYSVFPEQATLEIYDKLASYIPAASALTLHQGNYRVFDVYDEPQLTETIHLELEDEDGYVKSYLLPRGWPNESLRRVRQIPTAQQITNSSRKIIYVRLVERGGQ